MHMKLLAIATYACKAYANRYANRYAFDRVTVDKSGAMHGHWDARNGRPALDPTALGNISDCSTTATDTGVRFYNRHNLVYTFALPGAR